MGAGQTRAEIEGLLEGPAPMRFGGVAWQPATATEPPSVPPAHQPPRGGCRHARPAPCIHCSVYIVVYARQTIDLHCVLSLDIYPEGPARVTSKRVETRRERGRVAGGWQR